MRVSDERRRFASVAMLLVWCAALIACRLALAYDKLPVWLAGNLLLAVVPLLCSSGYRAASNGRHPLIANCCFCLWLLFLPNAPYILTDLIHLAPRPVVPLWYDLALLLSCAGTGLLLGYLSLFEVHEFIARRFGRTTGWTVACASLILSGFGMYLGRFLRWNSWNALISPVQLVRSLVGTFINPGSHPHPVPVTLTFGCGLIVGYLALRLIAGSTDSDRQAGGPQGAARAVKEPTDA